MLEIVTVEIKVSERFFYYLAKNKNGFNFALKKKTTFCELFTNMFLTFLQEPNYYILFSSC